MVTTIHHDLKTLPHIFKEVKSGDKTFELRNNDRDFKAGDTVTLHEWDLGSGYTGKMLTFKIGYVLHLGKYFKDRAGYVVFSLLKE